VKTESEYAYITGNTRIICLKIADFNIAT